MQPLKCDAHGEEKHKSFFLGGGGAKTKQKLLLLISVSHRVKSQEY